jgi:hypothetical protein
VEQAVHTGCSNTCGQVDYTKRLRLIRGRV